MAQIKINSSGVTFPDGSVQTTASNYGNIDTNTSGSTTLAVGTYVLVTHWVAYQTSEGDFRPWAYALNGSYTIYLRYDASTYWGYALVNKGYGSLSGTWRSRGAYESAPLTVGEDTLYGNKIYLFQRTA